MNTATIIPLIVTDDLAATKTFYTEVVGATPTIDMDGYLQVRLVGDDGPEIAFMTTGNAPVEDISALHAFAGDGLVLSIPVADVDAHHATITAAGGSPIADPADRPWGWRSYLLADPAGVRLDFFTPVPQPAGV